MRNIFFFLVLLLDCTVHANGNFEAETRQGLKNYLNVLVENGFGKFGTRNTLDLSDLFAVIDNTRFIQLNDEVFSRISNKTRRSAFYTTDGRVLVNADNPPSYALLTHEILKDEQYEVTHGIATLHALLTAENPSKDAPLIAQVIQRSLGIIIDRFGPNADSPHQWVGDQEVEGIQTENTALFSPLLGGDISGGGGDGVGFHFKSKVFLALMEQLAQLYRQELGYSRERTLNKLADLYYFLSIKIYFETDYNLQTLDEASVRFGTDKIERLLFFPYFVKVPLNFDERHVSDTVEIILQSDLFREIPSLERKYNSPCFCVTREGRTRLPYLCPDPAKTHFALHELMEFYKKQTELESRCRIDIGVNEQ